MGRVEVSHSRGNRSLFWPLMLIGGGSIWLLANTGIFDAANIAMLGRVWPLLLLGIGLNLLIGRNRSGVSTLIGLGTLALILLLMWAGPSLGLVSNLEVYEVHYTEPLSNAEQYTVKLSSTTEQISLSPLNADSANLMQADINYYGEISYETGGESQREIVIATQGNNSFSSNNSFLGLFNSQTAVWHIALNRAVPLALTASTDVGTMDLDLRGFWLAELNISMGVGETTARLPEARTDYIVTVNSGVGSATIELPEGAAVRLEAKSGVGDVNISADLQQIEVNDDFVGANGVWETDGFAEAENQITIRYDGGVGGLTIR